LDVYTLLVLFKRVGKVKGLTMTKGLTFGEAFWVSNI